MTVRTAYAHGTFCWVDLMAHDIDKAKDFYGGLFGWTSEDQDTQGGPPYVIFKHATGHGVSGMGQMSDEMKSQQIPPLWNSYINVDDLAATCEQATKLGGAITMPPMDVMQAGKMAIISDPSGANVSLWQKGYHFGAELVNDPGAFSWNELATRDPVKAKDFFHQLFGWEYVESQGASGPYFAIKNPQQTDGQQLNGGIIEMNEQWGEIPPHWSVYFSVEDVDAACSKTQQLGGGILMPAFDVPHVGRIAVVNDPQGASFNIIKMIAEPD